VIHYLIASGRSNVISLFIPLTFIKYLVEGMKYTISCLFAGAVLLLGCTKKEIIRVSETDSWTRLYAGLPSLEYSDSALKRINAYVQPRGWLATAEHGDLFFSSRDKWSDSMPMDYRKERLDSLARVFFVLVYGDREHFNRDGWREVDALVFRVDFSASGVDHPGYSLEFPYRYTHPLFWDIRPL
jgi:hypothetical protein